MARIFARMDFRILTKFLTLSRMQHTGPSGARTHNLPIIKHKAVLLGQHASHEILTPVIHVHLTKILHRGCMLFKYNYHNCHDFGFLDWNIYFHNGCNHSNDANEMMWKYFSQMNLTNEMQKCDPTRANEALWGRYQNWNGKFNILFNI